MATSIPLGRTGFVLCVAVLAGCLPDVERPPRPRRAATADATGNDVLGAAAPPACAPLRTGELLLNEVVVRPGGLDLDGDGHSDGRDEVVEVVSVAAAVGYAADLRLVWNDLVRASVAATPCLAPGEALLLVGPTTAPFVPPGAAQRVVMSHTLRLSDSGGILALAAGEGRRAAGHWHDAVTIAKAPTTGPYVLARRADGDATAPWSRHELLGPGLPWSPGRCVDGGPLPHCATGPPALRAPAE